MEDFEFVIPQIDKKYIEAIPNRLTDISYASNSPTQTLDIYFPENEGPRPTIVYFHGGAFMKGSKTDDSLEPMLRAVKRGYIVVSVNYRLSGEARFPAMVYDGKAVLRFLRAHKEEWHIDENRIAVWGPSAGGWLVAMLGATNDNPAFEDKTMGNEEYSSRANAVIDWCGPSANFLEMDKAFAKSGVAIPDHNEEISPESRFLGTQITKVPELCRLSAPITHIDEHASPFCIFHGEKDQVVPVEQSIELAKVIEEKCGKDRVELHVEKGKPHHGHPWYHEEWVSNACIDFLDRVFYGKIAK